MNTDPRRICLVTETYPPEINGVALTLARLAGGLRARGHAVSVVRPRQPGDGRVGGERGRDPELTLVSGFGLPGVQGGARRSARGRDIAGLLERAAPGRGVRGDRGAARMVRRADRQPTGRARVQWLSYELRGLRGPLWAGLARARGPGISAPVAQPDAGHPGGQCGAATPVARHRLQRRARARARRGWRAVRSGAALGRGSGRPGARGATTWWRSTSDGSRRRRTSRWRWRRTAQCSGCRARRAA